MSRSIVKALIERGQQVSLLAVLDQREVWIDKDRNTVTLDDMSPRYARNLIAWLNRRADRILLAAQMRLSRDAAAPHGDMAQDALDGALDNLLRANAEEWLEEQPLMQRLHEIAEEQEQ